MSYKTEASETDKMPGGIPYIIGNEAAERFSFYGMKAALAVFIVNYLHLLGDVPTDPVSKATSAEWVHNFNSWVYLTPIAGAILSDLWWGKYKTIISLSVVYCLGHFVLAFMGVFGPAKLWLMAGLGLITIGAGGIKPCVSAHVGDQFGVNNKHLLEKVFNWFYFSINLGAAVSSLMIPWVLKWYGPHWAFGIPGVLMFIATILFWVGRTKFVHIPAAGKTLLAEVFTPKGIATLCQLFGIFCFVAVFWALFDQSSTTWVFQAADMDLNLFGMTVLPSQVQAANPIMILTLIPVFTYLIYPFLNKFFKLTALRKMGIGLVLTASSFALIALVQHWIDSGESPNIIWQVFAYLLLTSGEIMVSIVCLEFAYTHSPKSMKSVVMALFLVSVSLGNFIASGVNGYIQVPNPTKSEIADLQKLREENKDKQQLRYAGYDGKTNTDDDILVLFKENGTVKDREVPGKVALEEAGVKIREWAANNENKFPTSEDGAVVLKGMNDQWGQPLVYRLLNKTTCRISSAGPDKVALTEWDSSVLITYKAPEKAGEKKSGRKTWLEKRKEELGISEKEGAADTNPHAPFKFEYKAGGLYKLEGAKYFWFFTGLMFVTALVFIPVSYMFGKRLRNAAQDVHDADIHP